MSVCYVPIAAARFFKPSVCLRENMDISGHVFTLIFRDNPVALH